MISLGHIGLVTVSNGRQVTCCMENRIRDQLGKNVGYILVLKLKTQVHDNNNMSYKEIMKTGRCVWYVVCCIFVYF